MKITILPALIAVLLLSTNISFSQCPTSGTISSDCTTNGAMNITGGSLTVNPGVTVTVTGTLTVRAGATLTGTGATFNLGGLAETYGTPNSIIGGTYNSGSFSMGSGGDFSISGATINISPNANVSMAGSNMSFNNTTINGVTNWTTSVSSLSMTNTDITASGSIQLEDLTLSGGTLSAGTSFSVTNGTNSITDATISGTNGSFTNLTMNNADLALNGTVAVSGTSSFQDASFTGVTNWTSNVSSLTLTDTDITASGSIQLEDLTLSGGMISAGTSFSISGGSSNTVSDLDLSAATASIRSTVFTDSDIDLSGLMTITNGAVTFDNSQLDVDALTTNGGTTLTVRNNSNFIVTNDMFNSENLIVDNALLDIGGDLDATGGDNITVRNNGELIVRGDYKMNNGGGVQLNLEDGGLVKIIGDVESTSGGNSIGVDDDSAISVGGNFTGGSPPTVSVGTDDEDADCLSGGGCCGDASACGPATTLPVTLIDFIAKPNKSKVELKWRTGTELNNDYFTIEKSVNGVDFSHLAFVPGSGTTNSESEYSFIDKSFSSSSYVYYRLSQTDFDGTHENLKINVINIDDLQQEVTVYPNPLIQGNDIHVQGVPVNTAWVLYSLSGEAVSNGVLDSVNSINSSRIPAGTYLLVFNGNNKETKRIVIK